MLPNNQKKELGSLNVSSRLVGVDVARAFAIFLMVIIHYFELNPSIYNNPDVYNQVYFLFGRARFIFYLIAGVGLFFLSKNSLNSQNKISLNYTKSRIITRGMVIGTIGVAFYLFILIYFGFQLIVLIGYGIFFFFFSFIFNKGKKYLVSILIILLLVLVLVSHLWIIAYKTLSNENYTIFSKEFFYSILYFLLEASTTILFGFLLATFLINKKYSKYFVLIGIILVIIPILLDIYLSKFLFSLNLYKLTNPNFPSLDRPILDYVSRIGSSFILIPIIYSISSSYKDNRIIKAIALSGQHSFTIYVFQIVLIIIITKMVVINTIFLATVYGLLTILVFILYSNLNHFTKHTKFLENILRYFSDSYKKLNLNNMWIYPSSPRVANWYLNSHNNFCFECGSKLNYYEPNIIFSISRFNFGLNIHNEVLKGSFKTLNLFDHIQYMGYLFRNLPYSDKIFFSEIYCPKDLYTILRVMNP